MDHRGLVRRKVWRGAKRMHIERRADYLFSLFPKVKASRTLCGMQLYDKRLVKYCSNLDDVHISI